LLRLSVLIDSKIVEHSAASDHVSATFAGADDAVPNTDDLDDRLQQNAVYLRRQHNDRRYLNDAVRGSCNDDGARSATLTRLTCWVPDAGPAARGPVAKAVATFRRVDS